MARARMTVAWKAGTAGRLRIRSEGPRAAFRGVHAEERVLGSHRFSHGTPNDENAVNPGNPDPPRRDISLISFRDMKSAFEALGRGQLLGRARAWGC
jgi:hypothetical protein